MPRMLTSFVLLSALSAAAVIACSSDGAGSDGEGGGAGASSGANGPGGGGPGGDPSGTASGAATAPPVPPFEFPQTIPSRGFALVDAFPGKDMDLPSAIVWPKVAGAPALVLERDGRVLELSPGERRQVLDFRGRVEMHSEGGAIGLALHPQFGDGSGDKPYAYFWYNAKGDPKKQRLSRFTWNAAARAFDAGSEVVLVEENETKAEHNGGRLAFGPDGFLYFGNGDDINSANYQRLDRALFAGIFRIDVDMRGGSVSHPPPRQPEGGFTAGYFIPNDNPFVGVPGALEEYYALGFRNPFGLSFDRQTGALWAGDVGDTWVEEIDEVVRGGNYEWPYREGEVVRGGAPTSIGTAHGPKYTYSHAEMGDLTAVMGGFVYRGKALPGLLGKYVYTDWPSGRVWALDVTKQPGVRTTLIDNEWKRVPLAVGEDNDGEIYVLHVGGIARLVAAEVQPVPKKLTETTLFSNVAALEPEPSLVPYEINSPLWSDGAAKRRWIRLPAGAHVKPAADGTLTLPPGTVLVKQFDLPESSRPRGRSRRLETRVLVVGPETTYGVTYRWNAEGTDADIVAEPTDEGIQDEANGQTRTWHYPSFGQCWSCHRAENRVLGFTFRQLARKTADGADQLPALAARGVFEPSAIANAPPGLPRPTEPTGSLEDRAMAYLAANCSGCHHKGASFLGGNDTWNASPGVPLAERGLLEAPHHNWPMAGAFDLVMSPLVEPGDPDRSILMARIKTTDTKLQMPPLGRTTVDVEGVRVVEEWIRSLPKN
jgi:uncharacterized repeat protein (TIGR03806 family)